MSDPVRGKVPLRAVVRDTIALGVLVPVLALVVLRDTGPLLELDGADGGLPRALLMAVLLLATTAAHLVSVPVRRGRQVEELSLLESALVVDALLLPARHALWLPVAAIGVSLLVTRRGLLKSAFNAGNLAASSGLLVLCVHLVAPPGSALGWRAVVGLCVGLFAFTAVNLANLARVLTAVHEREARAVLTDGCRLAVLTLPAHLSIAGTGVLAAAHAPALLPFALVPAVALLFAFRARAQEVEERDRSARLLELSHALAVRQDPDELLPTFLRLCREAFDVDVALAVLPASGASAARVLLQDRWTGGSARPAERQESELLAVPAATRSGSMADGAGRTSVLVPLEADGRRLGVVVLRRGARRWTGRRVGRRELLLLTPLANLLAAALQAAEHVQRLTEATSKLQAVVDQSSDGILVLDGDGLVQLWSPALAALSGCDETRAVGRPLGQLLRVLGADGTPSDAFAAGRERLSVSEPEATVELTLLREDGEQRVIRCAHAGAFVGGRLLRDVVLVHDITRERQVERLKADFIATVSHELRTPVTPIKGYADLLRRRGDSMSPERRNECLEVISDRSAHLARLVEDLLLASRMSAAEGTATSVQLSDADLARLVRRACGDFGDAGSRLRLSLPDGPLHACLDPTRTVQVLTNLIGNALKYSAPGSTVDVGLHVAGGRAVVEVVDRGRGIPADQVDRVFEKFHRVEDPMRMTTGGTGLGLYIARQLATAMHGELTCTSALGVGSTFRFGLPCTSIEAVTTVVPVPAQASGPPSLVTTPALVAGGQH